MVTISFTVGRDELYESYHKDYDMGYIMKHKIFEEHYTYHSPLILRKVILRHDKDLDGVWIAYDLIERETGKVIGSTDVYDDDDYTSEHEDYQKNIIEVAEKYPDFMKKVEKYKYPEII